MDAELLTRFRYDDYDLKPLGDVTQRTNSAQKGEIEISFASELRYLDIIQVVSDSITRMLNFDDDTRYWVGMSVRESVTNAILHGNKMDEGKRVWVRFDLSPDRLVIYVRDQGAGFDESKLPNPLDPRNLLRPSGRGIFYIRTFMDDVRYSVLAEGGMEVRMEKRLNNKLKSDQEGEANAN
ncbi:MAG: ATP-binding protein [Acidobacteria bacterium]|nr:MAG: ATP-binding protein [Acidobacteriota bacterium]